MIMALNHMLLHFPLDVMIRNEDLKKEMKEIHESRISDTSKNKKIAGETCIAFHLIYFHH